MILIMLIFVLQAEFSPVAARLPNTDASAYLVKIDVEKQ